MIKNIECIVNEALSLFLHFIIFLMSIDSLDKGDDRLKSLAIGNVLMIWIVNSVLSIVKFALKIVEFAKSRMKKGKVEPEIKKDIMICDLDT